MVVIYVFSAKNVVYKGVVACVLLAYLLRFKTAAILFGFESFLFHFFSNHITANFRESFPKPQCLCATLPGDLTNTTFSSHKRIVPRLPTSLCLLVLFCYISKKGFSRGFQKNRSFKYYLFGTFLIHTNVLMTY